MIEFMIAAPLVLAGGFIAGMFIQFVYDAICADNPEN